MCELEDAEEGEVGEASCLFKELFEVLLDLPEHAIVLVSKGSRRCTFGNAK